MNELLIEAYNKVKNHTFRVDREGSIIEYGDVWIKLGDVFYDVLSKEYFKEKEPKHLMRIIAHELAGLGCHFRGYGFTIQLGRKSMKDLNEIISRDMIIGERYLNQIHTFIDTNVFVEWDWYYFGTYGKGWQRAVYDKETNEFKSDSIDKKVN